MELSEVLGPTSVGVPLVTLLRPDFSSSAPPSATSLLECVRVSEPLKLSLLINRPITGPLSPIDPPESILKPPSELKLDRLIIKDQLLISP